MLSPQGLVRILQYPPPRQAVLPCAILSSLLQESPSKDIPRVPPTGRWRLYLGWASTRTNLILIIIVGSLAIRPTEESFPLQRIGGVLFRFFKKSPKRYLNFDLFCYARTRIYIKGIIGEDIPNYTKALNALYAFLARDKSTLDNSKRMKSLTS